MRPDPYLAIIFWLVVTVANLLLLVIIVYLSIKTFSFSRDEINPRAADARAEELLRSLLGEGQLCQLKTLTFLDVASQLYPQRFYRIPLMDGMVSVFEDGREIQRLCIQPTKSLPRFDVIAMHKLMIEGNEQEYLARANRFPPR